MNNKQILVAGLMVFLYVIQQIRKADLADTILKQIYIEVCCCTLILLGISFINLFADKEGKK